MPFIMFQTLMLNYDGIFCQMVPFRQPDRDTNGIQQAVRFKDIAVSYDSQTIAILDKEKFDSKMLSFFSATGELQGSIDASSLVNNASAFSLQFSPADPNLIAFAYRILTENTAIAIFDIERRRLVDSNSLENEGGTFTWAPDGSLLCH